MIAICSAFAIFAILAIFAKFTSLKFGTLSAAASSASRTLPAAKTTPTSKAPRPAHRERGWGEGFWRGPGTHESGGGWVEGFSARVGVKMFGEGRGEAV
jgi:hypothetical protein